MRMTGKMGNLIIMSDVYQNLSWLDKFIRVLSGIVVIVATIINISLYDVIGTGVTWHTYAVLLSIYPLITGILGWDPCYWILRVKTCSWRKINLEYYHIESM